MKWGRRGFTLLELLVVLSISGAIAFIVFGGFRMVVNRGRDAYQKEVDKAALENSLTDKELEMFDGYFVRDFFAEKRVVIFFYGAGYRSRFLRVSEQTMDYIVSFQELGERFSFARYQKYLKTKTG